MVRSSVVKAVFAIPIWFAKDYLKDGDLMLANNRRETRVLRGQGE